MARGRGGGTETEVAGRPLLPRHKGLPAAEKGGEGRGQLRGEGRGGTGEQDDTNATLDSAQRKSRAGGVKESEPPPLSRSHTSARDRRSGQYG